MRLLLDTCTFLWFVAGDDRLSDLGRETVREPTNEVFLSAASAWEISIKHGLGRLPLPEPPERFVPEARQRHLIAPLPLHESTVTHAHRLPPLHRDPFDRMLVTQAIQEELIIVTPDEQVTQYAARTLWL